MREYTIVEALLCNQSQIFTYTLCILWLLEKIIGIWVQNAVQPRRVADAAGAALTWARFTPQLRSPLFVPPFFRSIT